MEEARSCLQCGRVIKGRIDKKFCDDGCRNAFNNKQKTGNTPLMRNINNILRKNRQLLENVIPEGEGMGKTTKRKLTDAGFNFTYHTHQYTNKKGDTYGFCYEFGYLLLEGDWILVVKNQK